MITNMKIPYSGKCGRARKTWSQSIKEDLRTCHLTDNDPRNRAEWRSSVRRSRRLLSTPVVGMPAADEK
jgi:hypothetical protein